MEFYKPRFIMRGKDSGSLRIIDLWTFRSLKSNKRYIVEVEGFENEFYGLKFYWKGAELSKDRYSLLTNDFKPRTIVRSCIEVMLEYYRSNKLVSFGFVAATDLEKDIKGKKIDLRKGSRRFLFYQRMMINLFGPDTFYQVSDTTSTIYLMKLFLLISLLRFRQVSEWIFFTRRGNDAGIMTDERGKIHRKDGGRLTKRMKNLNFFNYFDIRK